MRYTFDHDIHVHSHISLCSNDPLQTSERIAEYALGNGLKTICLTNHFWDENVATDLIDFYKRQNFDRVATAKPLPKIDGLRFLFGCETDMDKNLTIGISKEMFDKFDFVVIPTTHLHMPGFTIKENVVTPKDKAECWCERFDALLNADVPFKKVGIPHLTCKLMDRTHEGYLETLSLLKEVDLKSLFRRSAKVGLGIEINSRDMDFADEEAEIVLRPYKIAKSEGCKFYLGSDAHHPFELDEAKGFFEKAIDLLGLTEVDKFILNG